MRRTALLLALTPALLAAVPARVSLGVFDRWGAFRDDAPAPHCWALARGGRAGGGVLRVGYWPNRGVRGQVSIAPPDGRVVREATLRVGGARVPLAGDGRTLWAPSPAQDAAILAALRADRPAIVDARNWRSTFPARGAASAIDAAAIGCAR